MASFLAAREYISGEWAKLNNQWRSTASQWRDKGKDDFERRCLASYDPTIREFLGQLDLLEREYEKARREIR